MIKQYYDKCDGCDQFFLEGTLHDVIYDGEYCDECYKDFAECQICSLEFRESDMIEHEDTGYVCWRCDEDNEEDFE